MKTSPVKGLASAILAPEQGRDSESLDTLLDLHRVNPDDAAINIQSAWIHDRLGAGLDGEDLRNAPLGLGSTYRALGRYGDSVRTLDRGTVEFPEDPDMKVFRAMALYGNGQGKRAVELLPDALATTDQPDSIARYRAAIAEYADDLDRTWR